MTLNSTRRSPHLLSPHARQSRQSRRSNALNAATGACEVSDRMGPKCPQCQHPVRWRRRFLRNDMWARWPCEGCGMLLKFSMHRRWKLAGAWAVPIIATSALVFATLDDTRPLILVAHFIVCALPIRPHGCTGSRRDRQSGRSALSGMPVQPEAQYDGCVPRVRQISAASRRAEPKLNAAELPSPVSRRASRVLLALDRIEGRHHVRADREDPIQPREAEEI